jgi:hypothetical protein
VPPDFLQSYRPDIIIVMNLIYCDEIRPMLARMGLVPEILTV